MTFRCSSVGEAIAALAWKFFKICSDFVGVGHISNVGEKQSVVSFVRDVHFFLKWSSCSWQHCVLVMLLHDAQWSRHFLAAWFLLLYCAATRANFLLRTVSLEMTQELVQHHDDLGFPVLL